MEMFTLKKVKIKGFRAYMQEKEFIFDNPIVLLFGENHTGKSSVLNAIEWCLFGNNCIGAKSGIRERIDWEIPNRNLGSGSSVFVEMELEDKDKNSYKILREYISKTKDELKLTLPNGRCLEGENGKNKLAEFLKCSFRDFLTTVYQHQETIRAILTQEPGERNDAIDRLLGLSDYRNILSGIEAAKLLTKQKRGGDDFDSFSREIDVALRTRESDLHDKREKAVQKAVREDQISEKGALEIARGGTRRLLKFASEASLSPTKLPEPEQWTELPEFQKSVHREINRFRSEMPDVKKQEELFNLRAEFTELKTESERKRKELRTVCEKLERFVEENRSEELLNNTKFETEKQISERKKEISKISAKTASIKEAMSYLKLEGINRNICPVCGKQTPDLLRHLEKEWEEKHKQSMGRIEKQIGELQIRWEDTESLLTQLKRIQKSGKNVKEEIEEVNKEISATLCRQITDKDDPVVLLSNKLDQIGEELKKLGQSVESKQKTLNEIVVLLEKIQLIVDILSFEAKKRIVEQIKQSQEYQQMEKLKDQMAILVDDVNQVKQAIRETSHVEARQRVSMAGEMIDNYFRRIANNPSVTKIEFSVNVDSKTGKNNYRFKDQNGKDLTPILSQGDLNTMALSTFLGMAYSAGATRQFGFVMLDDPSQSLGSGYKEKLVEVIDEVLRERTVVLSSMDKELQGLLLSKITKAKTKYTFATWTPQTGPEVRRE